MEVMVLFCRSVLRDFTGVPLRAMRNPTKVAALDVFIMAADGGQRRKILLIIESFLDSSGMQVLGGKLNTTAPGRTHFSHKILRMYSVVA